MGVVRGAVRERVGQLRWSGWSAHKAIGVALSTCSVLGCSAALAAVAAPVPMRVGRLAASRTQARSSKARSCRVPFVLGDGPSYAAEELRGADCELGGIRRPARSHSNRLIIVSQSVRPGTTVAGGTRVRLVLGPKPPPPEGCRPPRYVRVLTNSSELVAWVNPIVEADNAVSHGEGPRTYAACAPPHGAKHVFMIEENDLTFYAAVGRLRTAGHFIAFTSMAADHYNNGERNVVVFDALRGKAAFVEAYGFSEDRVGASIPAFALNSAGEVAWIKELEPEPTGTGTSTAPSGPPDTLQAYYGGHVHVIDASSRISGLTLRGQLLQWVSAGQTHSFALE